MFKNDEEKIYYSNELEEALKVPEKVKKLVLRGIEKIPFDILSFTGLEHLDLATNQFNEIPLEVFQLTNLISLSLWRNSLNKISTEIKNLSKLEYLNFSENIISDVYNTPHKLDQKLRYNFFKPKEKICQQ